MPPKIIEGDYQLYVNKPIDENTQGYQLASKAVRLASESAFAQKGFVAVDGTSSSIDPQIWQEVVMFTDAGKPEKRKKLPYTSTAVKAYNVQRSEPTDAIVFFQIFGKFSTALLTKKDVVADQAVTVGGAAASMALTGFGSVVAGGYTEYDYKISIFDASTGTLIWFREGHDNQSDVGSVGRLTSSIENVLKEHLPQSKNPLSVKKFSRRRSDIQANKGGVDAQEPG